jgi:hypothetical protein
VTVIELDGRRPMPCPHCDGMYTVRQLDTHIRFYCPTLQARRRHPAGRDFTPDGDGVA